MRIPDQHIQMQFRTVRRRFKGRYRRAVGPIEVTALLNVLALVGLMNVVAMAGFAAFIFVEKTTRYGVFAGRAAGILMLLAAVATLLNH